MNYRTPSEASQAFKDLMLRLLESVKDLPDLEQERAAKIPGEAIKTFAQAISVEDEDRSKFVGRVRELLTELERLLAGQRMLFSTAHHVVSRYLKAEDVSALFKEALDILDNIEEIIQADTLRQMGIKPKPRSPSERRPKAPKTYAKAQQEILHLLGNQGWTLSGRLKIPHATSPDGEVRFWFKAQAIYMSKGNRVNDMHSARSIWAKDYRFIPAQDFVRGLEAIARRAGAKT
jgi:hypothetical protein